ncbi:MAG: DNA mismatch repair endonuclease MutL [Planctomycetaceae bacterium]|nr:DNA mismatch repair endonuclease MutL [Planctomycetaceae bacterium]
MPIAVLPVHLVNKIAAGEVIERPASVVKELVENALDAGATRIDVTVEDGGTKLIAVSDDGSGMTAADLALAFAAHATSKLSGEDDLFRISTMGFRGEALASIASVAHAHIRTRRRDDPSGYEAAASGETIEPVRPCPSAAGTTVTVRDLFFNTPARRKFMRTVNTELGHISEQIARLALPHPHVAFTLTHNGREISNLPAAAATASRAADLFGRELAEGLLPIARSSGGQKIPIAGLLGRPDAMRSAPRWQYFFLNGRYIRDRLLSHALREAYRGLADPRSYPVAMIFIEIDPADVDVNVHPTKVEVRFRDSQAVHGALLAALRQTLNAANLSPSAALEADEPARPAAAADEQRRASLREAIADFFKAAPAPQPRLIVSDQSSVKTPQAYRSTQADDDAFGPAVTTLPLMAPRQPIPDAAAPAAPAPETILPARAIQIHQAYIVAACDDGVMIVDQHALHERVIYNDLRRRLTAGPLTAQRALIPETIRVSAADAETLERCGELLARLGIEVGPFGADAAAVHQFPALLVQRGVRAGEFMRELLDKLAEDDTLDSERVLESVLAIMACKAAVKAGQPLTGGEIDALLANLDEAEKASSCPHGRPTTLRLSLKDLEKQFKRV